MERRDVANKSEFGRMAMAQQRMQHNASVPGSGTGGMADGNARVASHGGGSLASENQVHQGSQSSGAVGSHDGVNSQVQESERSSAVEGNGNDQPVQQSSSAVSDGGQSALRRTGPQGLLASAASAFDAAKDIMEALRSKHTNLASELEVTSLIFDLLVHLYLMLLLVFFPSLFALRPSPLLILWRDLCPSTSLNHFMLFISLNYCPICWTVTLIISPAMLLYQK